MALPPGPRDSTLVQTLSWVRRPIPFMEELLHRYGDPFTVRLATNPPLVITTDPDTIRGIFTAGGEVLHAGAAGARVLSPLVGDHSVLVLDGAEHMRQRRLMLPSFHGARMKAYAVAMRDTATRAFRALPAGKPLPIHPVMQSITLEVIVRTVFGVEDATRMKRLGDQLTRILDMGSRPSIMAALVPTMMFGRGRKFLRERTRADDMIFDEIQRRRETGDFADRTDVLSLLMCAVDDDGQGMTEQELRDELVTILAAGHETSATSLAWTVERVLSHERVYEALRAEVDRELGDEPITDESLARLEYLDATVRESLRLKPIIPMVVRKLAVPMTIRGFDLPAGCIVAPNIYLTHRRPDVYPDPDAFRPERFVGSKPNPYAWLPFGGGIRRCLGMAFALYEMKIVLATLLQEANLVLHAKSSARTVRRAITFAPSGGVQVVIKPRRPLRAVA